MTATLTVAVWYYTGSWSCRGGDDVTLGLELNADHSGRLTGPTHTGGFDYRQDPKDATELSLRFGNRRVPLSVDDLTPGAPALGFPPHAETMDVRLAGVALACARVRTGV